MSAVAIQAALEVALATISPPLATSYENAAFTPTVGTPYQRIFMMMAEPVNVEMGTHTTDRGYLQISLVYPLNTGPAAAKARAEAIRAKFKRGLSFSSGGITTIIEKTPTIDPAIIEPDRYVVPVKVRFFANYRP